MSALAVTVTVTVIVLGLEKTWSNVVVEEERMEQKKSGFKKLRRRSRRQEGLDPSVSYIRVVWKRKVRESEEGRCLCLWVGLGGKERFSA